MSAQPEHYSMMDMLGKGYELRHPVGRYTFVLVQDGMKIVASINGEQHQFIGCTEAEIEDELAAWEPGTWKGQ